MYHYSWFFLIPGIADGSAFKSLIATEGELHNAHVIPAAWFVTLIILVISLFANAALKSARARGGCEQYVPETRLSARNVMELIVESVLSMTDNILKSRDMTLRYFPLFGTLFIYILFSNVLGLIPGFLPPTSSVSNNFAMALAVWVTFNYAGIQANGIVGYFKHFLGPVKALALVMLAVEGFSVLIVRPITLSVRLYLNMFADHLLLGVMSDLVPILLPSALVGLGIFVAFMQAFIFTLLTVVYVSLATAHEDHGGGEHAGHGHDGHDHAHAH